LESNGECVFTDFGEILSRRVHGLVVRMEDLANNLATATMIVFEPVLDADGDGLMLSDTGDFDSSTEVRQAPSEAVVPCANGKGVEGRMRTARSGVNQYVVCDSKPLDHPSGAGTHSVLASTHQLPDVALNALHTESSLTLGLVRQRAAALFPGDQWVPAM
jgi:hypothetical protein